MQTHHATDVDRILPPQPAEHVHREADGADVPIDLSKSLIDYWVSDSICPGRTPQSSCRADRSAVMSRCLTNVYKKSAILIEVGHPPPVRTGRSRANRHFESHHAIIPRADSDD